MYQNYHSSQQKKYSTIKLVLKVFVSFGFDFGFSLALVGSVLAGSLRT